MTLEVVRPAGRGIGPIIYGFRSHTRERHHDAHAGHRAAPGAARGGDRPPAPLHRRGVPRERGGRDVHDARPRDERGHHRGVRRAGRRRRRRGRRCAPRVRRGSLADDEGGRAREGPAPDRRARPRARRGVHRARGPRHRHADQADARARGPRRAELRVLRGRHHRAARPVLPGGRRVPELHDPQARRRCRDDHALERAAHAVDLAHRAGAGRGQHDRPQARRVVAAHRDAARRRSSRRPSCRRASSTSSTASARPPAPRCRRIPTCSSSASRGRRRRARRSSPPARRR